VNTLFNVIDEPLKLSGKLLLITENSERLFGADKVEPAIFSDKAAPQHYLKNTPLKRIFCWSDEFDAWTKAQITVESPSLLGSFFRTNLREAWQRNLTNDFGSRRWQFWGKNSGCADLKKHYFAPVEHKNSWQPLINYWFAVVDCPLKREMMKNVSSVSLLLFNISFPVTEVLSGIRHSIGHRHRHWA